MKISGLLLFAFLALPLCSVARSLESSSIPDYKLTETVTPSPCIGEKANRFRPSPVYQIEDMRVAARLVEKISKVTDAPHAKAKSQKRPKRALRPWKAPVSAERLTPPVRMKLAPQLKTLAVTVSDGHTEDLMVLRSVPSTGSSR